MYLMDILYSIIMLFIIALIWSGVIFLILKKTIGHQTKRDRRVLFGGLMLFIAMIAIVFIGTITYEYIESTQFCGTFCHVMKPYYDSYIGPGNNSMMANHLANETSCTNCHEEPGLIGKIVGLLRSIPEAYYYYTNTYDPENLGGEISRESCLKCHDDNIASTPRYVKTADGKIINPHADEKKCTDCHNSHDTGFGLKDNTCTLCHGRSLYNYEQMLLDHGKRSGEDCMECHNRKHPDDALIPYSDYPELINTDFCSDCHGDNVERLKNESHNTETCIECHNKHSALTINFDDCWGSCHNITMGHDSTLSICSVCHDLVTIHLKPGTDLGDSFSSIICSNCHTVENSTYESSFTPESLEIYGDKGCINCHSEHKAISYPHLIDPPFDDCSKCHSTYNKPGTIHDRTGISYLGFSGITNEFCSNCHDEEFTRFKREIHNSLLCIDCHSEHEILHVSYDKCNTCHNPPPSDHDPYLATCSGSTCHDNLRSIHTKI